MKNTLLSAPWQQCYKLKLCVHVISSYNTISYVHYQWVLICIVICIYK